MVEVGSEYVAVPQDGNRHFVYQPAIRGTDVPSARCT